jgi:cytochrome c-type biogenesis protein CcmH
MKPLDDLKRQLAELDALIAKGVLKGAAAVQARDELEAQVLALVAPGAPTGGARVARPSRRLLLGLAAFVLVFGLAGYAWLGNPAGLGVSPGTAPAPAQDSAHDTAKMQALAEGLAQKLQNRPDDAEGWTMLGRSYSALGRFEEAQKAFAHVLQLRPSDASALVDYADVLAVAQGGKLEGEPARLIARALQLDPNHGKGLALSGTLAFDKGDFAQAAQLWERAVRNMEPGSAMAQRLQGALDEARQRAGLPPQPAAADATGAAPAAAAAAMGAQPEGVGAAVQVRVSLAPGLAAQAGPEDTVFIFARALSGAKAPLAIARKQVKDLPLDITLDDSLAMSPALRISGAVQVVVGARVSKRGDAQAQSGDLQGLTDPVAVGARGVAVQIRDVLP